MFLRSNQKLLPVINLSYYSALQDTSVIPLTMMSKEGCKIENTGDFMQNEHRVSNIILK